jgi:hypothetical protein
MTDLIDTLLEFIGPRQDLDAGAVAAARAYVDGSPPAEEQAPDNEGDRASGAAQKAGKEEGDAK